MRSISAVSWSAHTASNVASGITTPWPGSPRPRRGVMARPTTSTERFPHGPAMPTRSPRSRSWAAIVSSATATSSMPTGARPSSSTRWVGPPTPSMPTAVTCVAASPTGDRSTSPLRATSAAATRGSSASRRIPASSSRSIPTPSAHGWPKRSGSPSNRSRLADTSAAPTTRATTAVTVTSVGATGRRS